MDTPLENDKADRALRALFQEGGVVPAPQGMEARVLQRIAVLPQRSLVPDAPLIPKWAWFVASAMVVALAAFTLSLPPGTSSWFPELPHFDLASVLASKWIIAAVACSILLFGLDHWLGRQRVRA